MFPNKNKVIQFLRFCTVGIGNTAIDFVAFYLLIQSGLPYISAQVLSYTAGVLNSFVFNRTWTFRRKDRTNMLEMVKFLVVNGCAFLFSVGLLTLFYDNYHLPLLWSKAIASIISIHVSFIGSRLWVFPENQMTRSDRNEDQKSSYSSSRIRNQVSSCYKSITERDVTNRR